MRMKLGGPSPKPNNAKKRVEWNQLQRFNNGNMSCYNTCCNMSFRDKNLNIYHTQLHLTPSKANIRK